MGLQGVAGWMREKKWELLNLFCTYTSFYTPHDFL